VKPARYIFINRGLEMSPGKIAAQAAHSETLAMHDLHETEHIKHELDPVIEEWREAQAQLYVRWFGDGHYAKYVMKADDTAMMYTIERYLRERDFTTYLVIDEGHTEGTYMVPTAMSVELVDKDDPRVSSIFSTFRMYKEKAPPRDTLQPEGNDFGFMTFLKAQRGKVR
jgi:peptidyl-tRNA hydrolase